jgi:hypothetical protein
MFNNVALNVFIAAYGILTFAAFLIGGVKFLKP